ncbi:hypothetical protein Efla_002049 [Eimeria flavescens]
MREADECFRHSETQEAAAAPAADSSCSKTAAAAEAATAAEATTEAAAEATEAAAAGADAAADDDSRKRGVVYVAQLPLGWTRAQVIRYFERFGEVTRVFLNRKNSAGSSRRGRRFAFTDGWIEFRKKRHAKNVVALLDGQPVGGKKRSRNAQDLLMLSYLKGFNFGSLYEEAMHVKRTRQDRLNAQMARVKKESQVYAELLEQKHSADQLKQRLSRKSERLQQAAAADEPASAAFAFAPPAKPRSTGKRKSEDSGRLEVQKKKNQQAAAGPASRTKECGVATSHICKELQFEQNNASFHQCNLFTFAGGVKRESCEVLRVCGALAALVAEPLWMPTAVAGMQPQPLPFGVGYPLPYIFPVEAGEQQQQQEVEETENRGESRGEPLAGLQQQNIESKNVVYADGPPYG